MKSNYKNNHNSINLKHFEDFLKFDAVNSSFDNNEEADYLLSNISSPSSGSHHPSSGFYQSLSGVKPSNLLNMSRFEGWTNHAFKAHNDDCYDNSNDSLLRYLNRGEVQHNYSTFDDYKFLDHLIGDKSKNDFKNDCSSDSKSKDSYFNFDELSSLCDNMMNDKYVPAPLKRVEPPRNDFNHSFEKEEHEDHYIREGTGTILKILEANQLWVNHTSAERVPIKLKKQFTKNDNFVVLIKKQSYH